MPLTQYILAEDAASLRRALDSLEDLETVGVDVERADWNRYWRAAALIQVGGEGRVALVDPLALDDLTALNEFLAPRLAVLHAMENDLAPLAAAGVAPARIADTAVAAALLGLPTGLEGLLRDLLGVTLGGDKSAMQRADWEARPLSADMLAYAAGDVADLPALWESLAARLEAAGRKSWYDEEIAAGLALPPVQERRDWSRTKGAGRLDAAARSRLRALWDARERLARDSDVAPGRILADRVLVDLATSPAASTAELGRRGVRRQAVRDFGTALIGALQNGPAVAVEVPRRSGRRPDDRDRERVDTLRALRADKAREVGVDAGVLCPSRTLLGAVLADPATPAELRAALGLRNWQWDVVGAAFSEALGLKEPAGDNEEEATYG